MLLVVPWLAGCVSGPLVRLDTGQGAPIVYTPPADQPPPVEVRQDEFVSALTELVLHMPLSLELPRREGRVRLASWEGESRDPIQRMMERQCAPSELPDGCLVLPGNAPPPQTLMRMRLALSFALDTVWEGAAVPLSEYLDPLAFKLMVYAALSTYLLTLMMPEPVTKGLAAVLTVYLVAYLGLGPVLSMLEAGWRLLEDSQRATTSEQLKKAGHRFGRVLGDSGMRVLLLLATAALSGGAGFAGKGPGLPGFGRAALASPARTGVALEAAGQVRSVALGIKQLTVVLAPTAVAATAMGSGGAAPKKGNLTGQPKQPRPNDDKETTRGLERENESARILAENGYDVEQNPLSNSNKQPDYKLNGEYADCYAPSTDNPRNIRDAIARKVNGRQADRIVLNLEDSQVTLEALKKQLLDDPIADLKEIIIVKGGKPILFHP
uniref:HNH/ENDo VIi superfamily nuclease n=1 Tax=Vitiosangium cumulatum TaxID=1867796 RepID=A0A7D5BH22_9BACT|nr:HNH/ENDo VIi superfamily nuclease [Vitiosangium cumulatum]